DGYPDFVFNASPVVTTFTIDHRSLPVQGDFEGQFVKAPASYHFDMSGSRDVMVMYNVVGVQLDTHTSAFSSPVVLESATALGGGCGVARDEGPITSYTGPAPPRDWSSVCAFRDVNGDRLIDRVVNGSQVRLGTGDLNAPLSAQMLLELPSLFGRPGVLNRAAPVNEALNCADASAPKTINTHTVQPLRAINGHGIPHHVANVDVNNNNVITNEWMVFFGTGTRFEGGHVVNGPFELSLQSEVCPPSGAGVTIVGDGSATIQGLYDIDGDGQPEVVVLHNGKFDV